MQVRAVIVTQLALLFAVGTAVFPLQIARSAGTGEESIDARGMLSRVVPLLDEHEETGPLGGGGKEDEESGPLEGNICADFSPGLGEDEEAFDEEPRTPEECDEQEAARGAAAEEEDTEETASYQSPNYDYTIAYDPKTWGEVGNDQLQTGDNAGNTIDRFELMALEGAPRGYATFLGTNGEFATAGECVQRFPEFIAASLPYEAVALQGGVQAASDADAFAMADLEVAGGLSLTGYLRCQTIAAGESYLRTLYWTFPEHFAETADLREALLAGVAIGGIPV